MTDDHGDEPYSHNYFEPPATFVKSAVRVLNVLEYFYRHREPARATEISSKLDFPVSSTKYLLTSLVESGYMTFDKATKKYFPSILFTGFASWLAEIYPSGETIRNLARDVRQQLGETVSVTVQHENHMRALHIEMDSANTPPSYDFRVRIPMIGSAGGLVAMSAMTDQEVSVFLKKEIAKLPPEQRQAQHQEILLEVRQTRHRGYAVKEHILTKDGQQESWLVVSVPLPVGDRSPPMALAVTGPKVRQAGREALLAKSIINLVDKYRDVF